jgi:hypothetical protein
MYDIGGTMIKKISNPVDEFQAQELVETILPNKVIRDIGLSILAEGIIKANSYRQDNWAITNAYPEQVWFQVGHYATVVFENKSIWIALDKQLIENPIGSNISFISANEYGWKPAKEGLSQFKDRRKPGNPFSINGYYEPKSLEAHKEIWQYMRELFFEFISKAEDIGQSTMHLPTKKLHVPGILMYLRKATRKDIPNPFYD